MATYCATGCSDVRIPVSVTRGRRRPCLEPGLGPHRARTDLLGSAGPTAPSLVHRRIFYRRRRH